ncbi:hypothetical protein [Thermodesulfobacterium hveragerdense]|uniref:hypothetical protein n=1 Tax=Thermodesulfobacterium hveragerdense TaxID=53424 RepID=UPI000408286E|nr:hypothetical protein [Thermodesulfobacterium hveragerdense]
MKILRLVFLWFFGFYGLACAEINIGILLLKLEAPSEYTYLKEALQNQIYHRLWVPSKVKTVWLEDGRILSGLDYLLSSEVKVEKEQVALKLKLDSLSSSPKEVWAKEEKVPRDQLFSKIAVYCEEIKRVLLEGSPQPQAFTPFSGPSQSQVSSPAEVNNPLPKDQPDTKDYNVQVVKEKRSFLSKLNPFEKLSDWMSNLFAKESEFKISISIPPPPPPPGVVVSQQPLGVNPQMFLKNPQKEAYTVNPAFSKPQPQIQPQPQSLIQPQVQPQPSLWQWF